jgi:flagellar hook-associated protein 1
MTISATMSNALSGLTAASRAAEVVSSNVANALTDGYARRELQLSSRSVGSAGQGVQVTGVRRMTDPVVTGDRRVAEAGAADRSLRADALSRIERAIGSPEETGSLTQRIATLETTLIEAASRPDSDARLNAVADAARALAIMLGHVTDEVQAVRKNADAGIGNDVQRINDALRGVADLNSQILGLSATGRDASALMDQRQQLIDGISALIPLREIQRSNGQIGLYTTGGAALLDGSQPARLEFAPMGVITAEMTLGSGALSPLTLNGRVVDTRDGGLLSGGELAARFALRDDLGPRIQLDLDAIARDLIERLAPPGPDATLPPGAPGLFTDEGAALVHAAEQGLAGRIALNAVVDPRQGGAVWRLRDGLGAVVPGPSGNPALLTALGSALTDARPTASGALAGVSRSVAVLASQITSGIASARISAETETSFTAARADALRTMELEGAIDTDRELQDLLMIERAYGANARVVRAVDEMIQLLLGV